MSIMERKLLFLLQRIADLKHLKKPQDRDFFRTGKEMQHILPILSFENRDTLFIM